MRIPTIATVVALALTRVSTLGAQQFFTPGAEVNGQISVQVNATLNDGIGEYQPVGGLTLTLYRGATDSISLRTDDAGVLRFAVAPGTYRLSTPEPVHWHGRSYRWNVPLVVQPKMGIVNLTVANAVVGGPSLADPPRRGEPVEQGPSRPARSFAQKDGATGVLFGFLLTGGGQFYAGANGKGAVLLGLSVVEVAGALAVIQNCDPYCSDSDVTRAQAFLLPAVFNWVYGMATAPGDVRRWNEEHSQVARVRPMVEQGEGRLSMGLAVRF